MKVINAKRIENILILFIFINYVLIFSLKSYGSFNQIQKSKEFLNLDNTMSKFN